MANREAYNRLRVDLYRRLLPRIQLEDQQSLTFGHALHWDDPDSEWDTANDPEAAVQLAWDAIGLTPIIQNFMYAIEEAEGEDLAVLESLDALLDPMTCPVNMLPVLARSFGYDLEVSIPEDMQRAVVLGLRDAYKRIGQYAGIKVWYRMIGFEVLDIIPLHKKDVYEENNDYNQSRYATTPITGQAVGPAGNQVYTGALPNVPIKPGTVLFTDGTTSARSSEDSDDIVGAGGVVFGEIDHTTGRFTVDFQAATVGAVTVDYEQVTEEWPYQAARIDIEINISPAGVDPPVIDEEAVSNILERLDECKPIHVLLRTLGLTVEFQDTLQPGATDQESCAQTAQNLVDPVPSDPLSFGLSDLYIIDEAVRGEDGMLVEVLDALGTVVGAEAPFDDRAEIVCPLDVLEIDTGGASPADGLW